MSEKSLDADSIGPTNSSGASLHTAGAMLRMAREASGLHVAALAVSMKVPVKKLEALEADRLDLLPDAVFVRALASSVCRALKIDPAPVLEKLPQNKIPRLDTEQRGINAPFQAPGETAGTSVLTLLSKPAALAVLALLMGVAIVAFWPEGSKADRSAELEAAPAQPTNAAALPSEPLRPQVEEVIAKPVPFETTSPPVSPSPTLAVTAVATTSNEIPKVNPVVDQTPVKAAFSGATVDLAGASSGIVVFKVRGPSWVEVTDGKGVVQLRKTMSIGESIGASGVLPLSVVVGRADVTDVEVKGKPFSLAAIAKDNVARFEVK